MATIEAKACGWIKREDDALVAVYPNRHYEYSMGGDYIGLIDKDGSVADFHITPHHPHLRDVAWLRRVILIERVVRVQR